MESKSLGYTYNYAVSKFLNEFNNKNYVSLNYPSMGCNGSSSDYNFIDSMLGSIGEVFERQSLTNFWEAQVPPKVMTCLNINKKRTERIKFNKQMLSYLYDTCGLSTYTSTEGAFENSLSEFIERQSFILSYLSKSPGFFLKKDDLFKELVPKRLQFMNLYEISFIRFYKVIFGIGAKKENEIYIGLGAGYTMEDALHSFVKEANPFETGKNEDLKKIKYLDYSDIFSILARDKILAAYDYLKESPIVKIDDINSYRHNRSQVLDELTNYMKSNLYMTSFFSKNNKYFRNKSAKSIKIFCLNWFPSLDPSSFNDETYEYVERVTGKGLNRRINFIPFP